MNRNNFVTDSSERICPSCSSKLLEPYIMCSECSSYYLCISCFAKGFESGTHQNNHSYKILNNNFPVLEFGWSAAEELKLLDALSDCGPGNWSAIASQVESKSKQECEAHYTKCYVVDAKYPLPDLPNPPMRPQTTPIPFKASEDPCRPLPDSHRAQNMAGVGKSLSVQFNEINSGIYGRDTYFSGLPRQNSEAAAHATIDDLKHLPPFQYLAARGDFVEEYDNYAEWDVQDVYFSPDDKALFKAVKMAVVKIYQSRLKERARRKSLIRNFGLINHSNHQLRYYRKLPHEIREAEENIRPLLQFQPHPIAHDLMLQGLSVQLELKKKISKLKEYRSNGIISHRVAKLYEDLKRKRAESKQHSNYMSQILPHLHDPLALAQWLQKQAQADLGFTSSAGPLITSRKLPLPPIDISDLPGVEHLNVIEKDFCTKARFVPEAFLSYKQALIQEYQRNGPVKLATARNVVKIDVNKTRKLFDFLIEQGCIEKGSYNIDKIS